MCWFANVTICLRKLEDRGTLDILFSKYKGQVCWLAFEYRGQV